VGEEVRGVNRDIEWLKLAICEFLGPFALVFAGVGAIIQTHTPQGSNIIAVAFAHGLGLGLLIAAVGHISGGHFNPAVTIGVLAARRITVRRAILYIVSQLLGGLAAAAALTLVYRAAERNAPGVNLGVPVVGHSIGSALVMEFILTFFLVFVIFGVAIDHRTGRAISGLAIGLTVTMDIFAGGAVSGAIMNPSRALGPAIVRWDWTNQWIWWVAPILGGLAAAVLYNYVLLAGVPAGAPPSNRVAIDHPRAVDEMELAQAEAAPSRPPTPAKPRQNRPPRRR